MKRLTAAIIAVMTVFGMMAAESGWTLTATPADSSTYSPPLLGNGQLGGVMDRSGLRHQRVISSTAVERGRHTRISGVIPAIRPLQLTVTANGKDAPVSDWKQQLDMKTGTVTTSFRLPGLEVTARSCALRSMPFTILTRLSFKALADVEIRVSDTPEFPDALADTRVTERKFEAGHRKRQILRMEGTYNRGADAMVSSAALMSEGWTQDSPAVLETRLEKGRESSVWAIASTVTTADFADPWNESERQVLYAISSGPEELLARHNAAWDSLWESDIIIEGNPQLQSHIRAALYNLYSSALPGSSRSIAPMGNTSTHYYGHIFWDADTWMLPALAVLHPQMARDMVDFRINTLPQARRRAAAHGYRGAMFPWESDDLGEEATPTFALTGPLEHHVTADVARGAWLTFCVTRDTLWLREKAYPLMRDIADFWTSRAVRNPDGSYSINKVVGADEYAINVDDNAFTNGAARRALEYAVLAAEATGAAADPAWAEVAGKLAFHKIKGRDVIANYKGYDGQTIKQADVALLAYPLDVLTDPDEIDRNISYYESKIDSVNGPAMSHSAMAVNYSRMGQGERAARYVERAYHPNLRGPFLNISETPGNNHIYFVTGAGGLLQALIFGYAGLDIDPVNGGLRQVDSTLPADVKSITVRTPSGDFTRRRH